jgi:DNA ligase-1
MEPLKNVFFFRINLFFNSMNQSLLQKDVKSCILDSEIVAFDVDSGKILPFQTLSTRKRKDVDAKNIQVQVAVFAFDILYLNGKSLLDTSLLKRRELLHASVQPDPGHIYLAEYMDTSDAEQIDKFLKVAVENDCEGLMVKTLEDNSTYEPDKRSHNWLKIKKDYLEGVTDTLDLVPIGAYFGKGKRTGVYGAYLLACYDRENEVFQSICKVSFILLLL